MRIPTSLQVDVSTALTTLFGSGHPFRGPDRLPDASLLKKSFRRRSLSAHPDRALALGRKSEALTREFQRLSDAYRLLLPLVGGGPAVHVWQRRAAAQASRPPSAPPDFFWRLKTPPAVPLRFAQYVYYRGLVSYRSLIRVLVRQMRERPRTGEIAVARGALTRPQVNTVLATQARGERFLQTAARLGYLADPEARRILSRQRSLNLPVGEIFVAEGLLTSRTRDALLREFREHNRSCSARAAS
jgi:hypothetical protein